MKSAPVSLPRRRGFLRLVPVALLPQRFRLRGGRARPHRAGSSLRQCSKERGRGVVHAPPPAELVPVKPVRVYIYIAGTGPKVFAPKHLRRFLLKNRFTQVRGSVHSSTRVGSLKYAVLVYTRRTALSGAQRGFPAVWPPNSAEKQCKPPFVVRVNTRPV
jgi:hypothetical protein